MAIRHLTAIVFIFVKGILCNSPPILINSIDLAVVSENTPVGSSVFQLLGRDPEESPVYYGLDGTTKLTVDRNTGIVTVAEAIDREVNDTLAFVVTLEDEVGGGNNNNVIRVPVTVIVLDENDNAPRFHQVPYEVEVSEDTAVESTIFERINVTDIDVAGSILEIKCVFNADFPDACDVFRVTPTKLSPTSTQAAIVLAQPLDYSKNAIYQVQLQAEDGAHTSITTLTVSIGDVQNQPPVFISSMVAIVSEDTPIGSQVMTLKAMDGDKASPRKLFYELLTNPGEYFSIDSETGEIQTGRPLNREAFLDTNGIVTLRVRVSEIVNGTPDYGDETSSVSAVTVTIKDVNDEAPVFNLTSYSVNVNENLPNGTPLPGLDMFVQDLDIGTNSVFNLEVMDPSGIFSIEPTLATGSTSVSVRIAKGPLDYENPNQRKFILLVIARESFSAQKLSSTATVSITTMDVNDNPPEFELESYRATLSETATPGTVVATITAQDRDSGVHGVNGIVYSLFGNGADRFTVSRTTGVISVAPCETPGSGNCLDYEAHPIYLLSYQAVDENGTGHTTVVPITIALKDADDNPPYFLQSLYQAVINEGSTQFEPALQVKAKDLDITSVPQYSIIAGNNLNFFAINSLTGEITLASEERNLDVSSLPADTIVLTVQARDSGQGVATTTVKITVRDSNNNSPIFLKESYLATTPEVGSPGTFVEQVSATDADTGVNALLTYRIHRGGFDDFSINSSTGEITVAPTAKLDYDKRKEYVMEVVAVDAGVPSHTGTTTVTVQLINHNDKAPYFSPTTQRTEVSEGAVVGYTFYKVIAKDPDVASPDLLRYALVEPISALDKDGRAVSVSQESYKNFFNLVAATGEVRVASEITRDTAAVVRLTITVTDTSANPRQTGTGTVVVTIIDRNDMAPSFAPPWTRESPNIDLDVMEEQSVGTVVGSVVATDPESNIAGYEIMPENTYFAVDKTTGVITIKGRIDYEEIQTIRMNIVAYDTGIPQLSAVALVTCNVINTNDNDPVFSEESYKATLRENSLEGTIVTTISATDADAGDFGKLQYAVIGERGTDFIIYQDGSVRVAPAIVLDREISPRITIQIVATDQGRDISTRRSRSVPVYIDLEDENDNPPKFTQREYLASIVANISLNPPSSVTQVTATDLDEGLNAKIKYNLVSGNKEGTFRIDSESGVIYPVKVIAEHLKEFTLRVRAGDRDGEGHNFDEANVKIKVLEINQEKPKFIFPASVNATIEIPENQNIQHYLIMTVKALDNDRGENGRISYYLKVADQNVAQTEEFHLNGETGELRTKVVLDREKTPFYKLILVARDNGKPVFFETLSSLTIVLKDVNDNIPQFTRTQLSSPYVFTVRENLGPNEKIGRVNAVDLDEGLNSVVYYYITESVAEGAFKIDRMYGDVYTNATFDRELRNEYEFVVKATSNADYMEYQPHSGRNSYSVVRTYKPDDLTMALVKIRISDMNDNVPTFKEGPFHVGLRHTAQPGDTVEHVQAQDPDEGANGTLNYAIEYVNLFRVGIPGSVRPVPSPFNITQMGVITTTEFMTQYDQARFHISVKATEVGTPHRSAKTIVKVWIYQPDQLVKVVITQPPEEVHKKKKELQKLLKNAMGGTVIIDTIRYHVGHGNKLERTWTDLYVYVADDEERMLPLTKVLDNVDINADLLKMREDMLQIHNIVPAYITQMENKFDPSLAVLITLLVVLGVGIITMVVCCFCLKSWYVVKLQKAYSTCPKPEVKPKNTIENPLWTEQKVKLYEEQELSMSVAPDGGDNKSIHIPDDNASAVYATLRRSTANSIMGGESNLDGFHTNSRNEYATLNGVPSLLDLHQQSSSHPRQQTPADNADYHELRCATSHNPGHSGEGPSYYDEKELVTHLL